MPEHKIIPNKQQKQSNGTQTIHITFVGIIVMTVGVIIANKIPGWIKYIVQIAIVGIVGYVLYTLVSTNKKREEEGKSIIGIHEIKKGAKTGLAVIQKQIKDAQKEMRDVTKDIGIGKIK